MLDKDGNEIDFKALVTEAVGSLKESLAKDVAATVIAQINAGQKAAQEQADKVAAEQAKAAAETKAKVDAGELLEFPDEASLNAAIAAEANEAAIAEAVAA